MSRSTATSTATRGRSTRTPRRAAHRQGLGPGVDRDRLRAATRTRRRLAGARLGRLRGRPGSLRAHTVSEPTPRPWTIAPCATQRGALWRSRPGATAVHEDSSRAQHERQSETSMEVEAGARARAASASATIVERAVAGLLERRWADAPARRFRSLLGRSLEAPIALEATMGVGGREHGSGPSEAASGRETRARVDSGSRSPATWLAAAGGSRTLLGPPPPTDALRERAAPSAERHPSMAMRAQDRSRSRSSRAVGRSRSRCVRAGFPAARVVARDAHRHADGVPRRRPQTVPVEPGTEALTAQHARAFA